MMERVALSAGRCGSECVEYSKSIKYPAKYRTWIQGYNIDADGVKQEIKALKDTNYPDYMVWLASGDKKDIDRIKSGF